MEMGWRRSELPSFSLDNEYPGMSFNRMQKNVTEGNTSEAVRRAFRIFGRTVVVESMDGETGRALMDELRVYPEADMGEPPELTIRHGPAYTPGVGVRLVNPSSHHYLEDGFHASYGPVGVRFRLHEGRLVRVEFSLQSDPAGLRRWITRWRNLQFSTNSEAIGQIFHELVLIPAVYFDPHRFLLHAAGVEAPTGGVTLIGGTGGVGKTSLEIELCRSHGYRFVADDIVVASPRGVIWPNLAFPKIYGYNLAENPAMERDIFAGRPFLDRLQWHYRLRRNPATIRRRVTPDRLYGDYSREGGRLHRYIVLTRENRPDIHITDLDSLTAARMSVRVMEAEYGLFHQHLCWSEFNELAAGASGAPTLRSVLERWEWMAAEAFGSVECLQVRLPEAMDHGVFRRTVSEFITTGRTGAVA
jgi:hypothetical protein